MSKAEIVSEVSVSGLDELQKSFEKQYSKKITASKMTKVLEPVALLALKSLQSYIRSNHTGPTGNLLKGTASRIVEYPESGNAVALIGYRATGMPFSVASSGTVKIGPDRAFHAILVEFGTKQRKTKGPVASSFKRFGPFKMVGRYASVKTSPAYPNAFFKKGQRGQPVSTGRVLPLKPIENSFEKSKSSIKALIESQASSQLIAMNRKVAG